MHVLHVVGARPNFMKAAPVLRALTGSLVVRQTLIHTGQHYDTNMSHVFFRQLEMPEPDVNLGVGSGSHSQQTAEIISRFEPIVSEHNPTSFWICTLRHPLHATAGDQSSDTRAASYGATHWDKIPLWII